MTYGTGLQDEGFITNKIRLGSDVMALDEEEVSKLKCMHVLSELLCYSLLWCANCLIDVCYQGHVRPSCTCGMLFTFCVVSEFNMLYLRFINLVSLPNLLEVTAESAPIDCAAGKESAS